MGRGPGIATSCSVGHRCSSDLVLLWLRPRPAAAALIESLVWEFPYVTGAAVKRGKKSCWNSNPQCDGIRRWSLWEAGRSWGWSPQEGVSALIRGDTTKKTQKTKKGDTRDLASSPQVMPSVKQEESSHLRPGLSASRTVRSKCLLSYLPFVMAAWTMTEEGEFMVNCWRMEMLESRRQENN